MILESATSATTYDGMPRNHSKNDNPEWSYFGRSYGVGSSQGIVGPSDTDGSLQAYSYVETGYLVDSQCNFNNASAFTLRIVVSDYQPANGSNIRLDILVANGTLPNANDREDTIAYPLVLTNQTSRQDSGILTWVANSKNGRNMISIAASGLFEAYNNMQCSVNFTLTCFMVDVNVTSSTMSVAEVDQAPTPQDPPFDGNSCLRSNAMASLSLLAQTAASITFETLGESLANNLLTFNQSIERQSSNGISSNVTYDPGHVFQGNETSILQAAEDSFNAMLDDILVGYGAAQLFWSFGADNFSITNRYIPVNSTYSATRLGQDGYIFATLAINLVLIIIGVEEVIRTRNWERMPLLDYLNLKSVIVATSAGGKGISEDCHRRHPEGASWDGNNSSKEAAAVRICLGLGSDTSPEGPVIMLAQEKRD